MPGFSFSASPFRGLILLILLAFAGVGPASASTVLHESLASATLGRDYAFTVYLPDGYNESGLRYPVVYLLHGASGDENDWLDKGKVQPTLDRLITEQRIQPVVVVMPGHKGAWWVDGNAEQAETVLLKELLPTVESRFRVFADRQGRAFAGLSAGGYATIRLALIRPELFAAGAALSPAIYVPDPPETSSGRKNPPFLLNGEYDSATWQRLNWPPYFDAYVAQDLRVPLYLNSGDHDRFEVYTHAADFYHKLEAVQPGKTVYHVVPGDHEWRVWEETIGDALEWVMPNLKSPTE